ncbi:AMP-binding protein [Pseudonocardia endophytica]|uniref:Acyl-CoA synthetase (AMP-forming)/AMP-acid ligase II n=1 Tax=Pseudonocardia endophytica TaxID=401976 RepID=A0A4V2PIF8_PSEEN|nr:AMP-binding protein [Pseudonocardia endophytica]TCK24456.1 acyl-CoA synthetase (AMP-forming)/AMP-acid ligase II [Pseudonocardia endophytica]
MEYPTAHARTAPGRAAVIDERTGTTLTYGALEERSRAVAHRLWDAGLRPGDQVALAVANAPEFYEFCWAAHRIGLYYTAVNTHLTPGEARHVLTDCGAEVLLTDGTLPELDLPDIRLRLALGEPRAGHEPYEDVASGSTGPLPHEGEGEKMLYTSGTTGVPKGVARPLTDGPPGSVFLIRPLMLRMGFGPESVLVNPAPLYHSAPLGYGMGVHRLGGTVVIDGRFDAARCLSAMERHAATHGLFVPTMFSRMLALPDHERYDVSHLVTAAHGAAPCPVPVKRRMIDWWGPRIVEYYAGTEGAGMTMIDSDEWLAHQGSVGRPVSGAVHIVDPETGDELGPGETGTVSFTGGAQFRYHGDDAKTAAAYDDAGRNTLGDIGHVDHDGYLYLTDRASFTVISGGVNIYPREAENVLLEHPLVDDVAAFGVPDDDLGEALVAVVVLADPAADGEETVRSLAGWCTDRLARQKCPRRITFTERLPRTETGKLAKRTLREHYTR